MRSPAIIILAFSLMALNGCNSTAEPGNATTSATGASPRGGLTKLNIIDDKVGVGDPVQEGDIALVEYTGTFKDKTKEFDSNKGPGLPYSVVIGQHRVVPGWEQGLVGMKKGGIRRLEVPFKLGYGDSGTPDGKILPRTDLYFTIKLLDVVKKGEETYEDTLSEKVGSGPPAVDGSKVTVKYVGRLVDGTIIDQKYKNKPKSFTIGEAEALPFMEFAVKGMKAGGRKSVRIPPGAAYGAGRMFGGTIPPYSVLLYDIEVLAVKKS